VKVLRRREQENPDETRKRRARRGKLLRRVETMTEGCVTYVHFGSRFGLGSVFRDAIVR
jgi:hypothetical protein